ncbi:hypothetical protein M409DRAFT_37826 [Zasmidium cellare ATCC 36951]|uniref:aldehyde dehydrogenase (NAD(+)) n=1 Tax=Zasmidium cellare ATCC 36951 TaxID=1080233 RepID=A0A6A6C117_ZASCE|nr:uncharacterized protein M409DRAFT_37826 [Zasmidium cellare ATCC 36951]KAF2159958.1 hypothetical protein M409DRAFT_37826 [Zasmidium cellare ATCC 36951]
MAKYETRHFIDGKFVEGSPSQRFDVKNPVSGELIASVPAASEKDVQLAVDATKKAQPAWAALAAKDRAKVLRKFADLMEQNAGYLAELDAVCMGKPVSAHRGEVETACDITNFFAGQVEQAYGQSALNAPNHLNISLRQPFGVVAAIVPWNFPTMIWCHEVPPACGAGNAVILKTSEKSPLSGLVLAELALKAGFPPGIVNVVSGAGPTGELLSSHMQIRRISFTGSTRAGRAVMQAAAKSNLKSVNLELGGKSPLIVFADADLEAAAELATTSITYNSGQVCTASSRAYIQKGAADAFKKLLIARFEALKLGAPTAGDTDLGPQADAVQAKAVARFLEVGNQYGKALTGGKASNVGENYVQPTIFFNIKDDSRINVEEVFGPVLVLHEFDTESEVLQRANASEYGLYASVFTSNVDTALRVARGLEAGNVGVNCTSPFDSYELPFGGYKVSGIGRSKGSNAVLSWLEEKSVYIRQKPGHY